MATALTQPFSNEEGGQPGRAAQALGSGQEGCLLVPRSGLHTQLIHTTSLYPKRGQHTCWAADKEGTAGTFLVPEVKTPRFHCRGHRFDPWSGN